MTSDNGTSPRPGKKRGPKPITGPEIYDECFEIHATKGWAYTRIAEHLLAEKKISNKKHPGQPVTKHTIGRWIAKGEERMAKGGAARRALQQAIAGREIDYLKEEISDAREGQRFSFEDLLRFVETMMKLHDRRVKLYGLNTPVKTMIEHLDGPDTPPLDRETAELLAGLERYVDEQKVEYGR